MTARIGLLAGLAFGLLLAERQDAAADDKDKAANAKGRMTAAKKVYEGILLRQFSGVPVKGLGLPPGPAFGLDLFEHLHRWSLRWLAAQRETSDKPADQMAALKAHLARMRDLAKMAKSGKKGGTLAAYDVAATEFFLLEAEKLLEAAKK
jgi:hypothetical protein